MIREGSPRRLPIFVVLDTSVVKTKATELVALDVKRLIDKHYEHLDVHWQLPRAVVLERQHQMVRDGRALLNHRAHLEFLVEHKLEALSDDRIEERISRFVSEQITGLRIEVLDLDPTRVNWDALIEDAVRRRGVFQGSDEKEKGFRDRVIAETFVQHPNKEPDYARRGFVSTDHMLADYVAGLVSSNTSVSVLRSITELTTHLGTLNSQLKEELVNVLTPLATESFLAASGGSGLFLTAGVPQRIINAFGDVLRKIPEGATSREQVEWTVDPPSFIGLLPDQLTEWESRVVLHSRVTRPAQTLDAAYTYSFGDDVSRWAALPSDFYNQPKLVDKYGTAIRSTEHSGSTPGSTGVEYRQEAAAVEEVFAVRWSAHLQDERLSDPELRGEIEHIETRGLDRLKMPAPPWAQRYFTLS